MNEGPRLWKSRPYAGINGVRIGHDPNGFGGP